MRVRERSRANEIASSSSSSDRRGKKIIFAQNAIARRLAGGPDWTCHANRGTGFRTPPTFNGGEIINGCRKR